jgi:hypothetical protein
MKCDSTEWLVELYSSAKTRILAEKHVPSLLCQQQIPLSTGLGTKFHLRVMRTLVQIYYFSSSGEVKCIGCIT